MGRNGTRLGQNFLTDAAATLRIAAAPGDLAGRTVVEIGPGHGVITAHLAPRCGRLHLVEFDPGLAKELAFRYRATPSVTVHHADILHFDLRSIAPPADDPTTTLDVVGNLPYYITSEILLHLFAAARDGLLRRAVLMTQFEVAERLAAQPGHSEYGALSALTALHATVDTLFTLPPEAFTPPPKVRSTVVRLNFAPRFAELDVPFAAFNSFLRGAFAQKRKTLANNLRVLGYNPDQIQAAWPADLPLQVRSEAVPLTQLAALYRSLTAGA